MNNDTYMARNIGRLVRRLHSGSVRVEVEEGVVYLEGVVETRSLKERLEQRVSRIPGVRQVINCLALEHVAVLPGHGLA